MPENIDLLSVASNALRLAVAALLGGVLGYQREKKGKAAGLRTHMLVALGAAVFVVVPIDAGLAPDDVGRIIQGLVAGIGFLCAGAIFREDAQKTTRGLTTAANLWLTAALGMTVGLGRFVLAIVTTLLALIILAALPVFEHRDGSRSEDHS